MKILDFDQSICKQLTVTIESYTTVPSSRSLSSSSSLEYFIPSLIEISGESSKSSATEFSSSSPSSSSPVGLNLKQSKSMNTIETSMKKSRSSSHSFFNYHRDFKTNVPGRSIKIVPKSGSNNDETDLYRAIIHDILHSKSIHLIRSNTQNSIQTSVVSSKDVGGDYKSDDDNLNSIQSRSSGTRSKDGGKYNGVAFNIEEKDCFDITHPYNHRRPKRNFSNPFCNSNRAIRFFDFLGIIACFFISIILFLLIVGPMDSFKIKTFIWFISIWFILSTIFLLLPTFKQWFFYWNPNFKLNKPS
ncbi:hypothetical protein SSS_08730 [Sarcoptes scabiei]|uniref:Uncharacterized protein n=1 Tax=Sarcoptes scabiei TaxID=52283 RepID=A0A834VIA6_SARSC|nr:hypothetical protein SSS_08730 [Sarcoptes scabiei]